MKKFLFGFAALAVLATSSCKKDDESSAPANSFKIAGETYTVTNFTMLANTVLLTNTSSGTTGNSITFSFGTGTAAPAAGTYKIVSNADETNEVSVAVARFANSTTTAYGSQDGTSATVVVGKDGDKMTITMAETDVKQIIGGSETIKVSANAKQL